MANQKNKNGLYTLYDFFGVDVSFELYDTLVKFQEDFSVVKYIDFGDEDGFFVKHFDNDSHVSVVAQRDKKAIFFRIDLTNCGKNSVDIHIFLRDNDKWMNLKNRKQIKSIYNQLSHIDVVKLWYKYFVALHKDFDKMTDFDKNAVRQVLGDELFDFYSTPILDNELAYVKYRSPLNFSIHEKLNKDGKKCYLDYFKIRCQDEIKEYIYYYIYAFIDDVVCNNHSIGCCKIDGFGYVLYDVKDFAYNLYFEVSVRNLCISQYNANKVKTIHRHFCNQVLLKAKLTGKSVSEVLKNFS